MLSAPNRIGNRYTDNANKRHTKQSAKKDGNTKFNQIHSDKNLKLINSVNDMFYEASITQKFLLSIGFCQKMIFFTQKKISGVVPGTFLKIQETTQLIAQYFLADHLLLKALL